MKAKLREHPGCFGIDLTAETMEDAALLVRFGMNRTSELRNAGAMVNQDGSFSAYMVIGKRKDADATVQRRR